MSQEHYEIRFGAGRVLKATPVLDTYWRFAQARQEIFFRRVSGAPPPWTEDPVLAVHRFTNVYRASDRVSQFLIHDVIYAGDQTPDEVFFRTLFFKLFNRIETWRHVERIVGVVSWREFHYDTYADAFDALLDRGVKVYSNAYIMPSPNFGEPRKHRNHLRLLQQMMKNRLPEQVASATSLQAVFEALLKCPSLGRFLAFQFAIDLNYGPLCDFSEMDFVVAGPGAIDGIRKCFSNTAGLSDEDVIRVVTERASENFDRLGIAFRDLWGRSLQLIDCQNLFCEVGKYARVVHPDHEGVSGRTRIKQRFAPGDRPVPQWYPPKWGINPVSAPELESEDSRSGDRLPFRVEPFELLG